jgi:hypothetical protein
MLLALHCRQLLGLKPFAALDVNVFMKFSIQIIVRIDAFWF